MCNILSLKDQHAEVHFKNQWFSVSENAKKRCLVKLKNHHKQLMTYVDTEEIQKRMLLIVTLMIVAILIVTLKIITETELALKLACC